MDLSQVVTQLMRAIVQMLSELPAYRGKVATRRTPDVLITGHWALEFKLARPFGDNGRQAENWSFAKAIPASDVTAEQARCDALSGVEQRRRVVTSKLDRGYEDFVSDKISEEFWTRKSREWEAELATVDASGLAYSSRDHSPVSRQRRF